jgi:hypothetical protein
MWGTKQTLRAEIFSIVRITDPTSHSACEFAYCRYHLIQGHFNNCEFLKVEVSPLADFQIDEIVCRLKRRFITQHLVSWAGYDKSLNSVVNVSDIKHFQGISLRNVTALTAGSCITHKTEHTAE